MRQLRFLLILLAFTGCCISPRITPKHHEEPTKITLTQKLPARGVVILAHGLNQRPSSLDPIAEAIRNLGYHTLQLTFKGHDKEDTEIFLQDEWENDLLLNYREMRARFKSLSLSITGYSLGGLITVNALDKYSELNPESVVLIAPALSLRPLPQAGYLLNLFPPLSISVPNVAPPYYRRFERTPLFWYRNTFNLYTQTRALRNPTKLAKIDTLVIANPRDELVSFSGLRNWIKDSNLQSSWKLERTEPQAINPAIPGHVLVDQRSLGINEWTRLLGLIKDVLFDHSTSNPGSPTT